MHVSLKRFASGAPQVAAAGIRTERFPCPPASHIETQVKAEQAVLLEGRRCLASTISGLSMKSPSSTSGPGQGLRLRAKAGLGFAGLRWAQGDQAEISPSSRQRVGLPTRMVAQVASKNRGVWLTSFYNLLEAVTDQRVLRLPHRSKPWAEVNHRFEGQFRIERHLGKCTGSLVGEAVTVRSGVALAQPGPLLEVSKALVLPSPERAKPPGAKSRLSPVQSRPGKSTLGCLG